MKNIIEIGRYLALAAVTFILGSQFLAAYKNKIRNEAIDGCASQSTYQASFGENGRQMTISEPQKYLYEQCLSNKGVVLSPSE